MKDLARAHRAARFLLNEVERRITGAEPDRRFDPFVDQIADAYDLLEMEGVEMRFPAEIPHRYLRAGPSHAACLIAGCNRTEEEHEPWH